MQGLYSKNEGLLKELIGALKKIGNDYLKENSGILQSFFHSKNNFGYAKNFFSLSFDLPDIFSIFFLIENFYNSLTNQGSLLRAVHEVLMDEKFTELSGYKKKFDDVKARYIQYAASDKTPFRPAPESLEYSIEIHKQTIKAVCDVIRDTTNRQSWIVR